MIIDYCLCSGDIDEIEAKENIKIVSQYKCVESVTVPYYLIKSTKTILANKSIKISALIDYPLGLSDSKTRMCAVEQSVKNGADWVDVCMPQNLASNRKYEKIREDIKNLSEITPNLRYILEYRKFDHNCLKKMCEIFDNFNIKNIFPSSNFFIDNLSDNIIASVFLYKNSKEINVYCTGNAWTNNHFDLIDKSGLFGFRTNSVHSVQNYNLYHSQNNGV